MNQQLNLPTWISTFLMVLLVGTGSLQAPSGIEGRPPVVAKPDQTPLHSQQTTARLWEDPLEAAIRSKPEDKECGSAWNAARGAFQESIKDNPTNSQARDLIVKALNKMNVGRSPAKPINCDQWLSLPGAVPFARAICTQAVYELFNASMNNSDSPTIEQTVYKEAIKALGKAWDPPKEPSDITDCYIGLTNEWISSELADEFKRHPHSGQLEIKDFVKNIDRSGLKSDLLQSLDDHSAGRTAPHPTHLERKLTQLKEQLPKESLMQAAFAEQLLADTLTYGPLTDISLDTLVRTRSLPATLLLPVVVPEQMYVDVREQRLRLRYAVVSALGAANFDPESADELNVLPVPIGNAPGTIDFGRVISNPRKREDIAWIPISYEVFRSDPDRKKHRSKYKQVVVFWIDARIVKQPSLFPSNIQTILDTLTSEIKLDKQPIKYLSTGGSETLTNILAQNDDFEKNDFTDKQFYFPYATLPKDIIDGRVKKRMAAPNDSSEPMPRMESVSADKPETAVRDHPSAEPMARMNPIMRVQASDDYVIDMLLDELSLRIPGFENKENKVCLLYETDSFYGRSMVEVFNDRYQSFTSKGSGASSDSANALSYRYLKGIDGNVQSTPTQNLSKSTLDIKDPAMLFNVMAKYMEGSGAGQLVQDQRQIDYLRRLAHSLKTGLHRDAKGKREQIRAIGVFGTNVSDKIQIIEIFRKEFTNVWFFTVNLDAAFVSNNNPLITRNVLIGSALDTSIALKYDRDKHNSAEGIASTEVLSSPVFRDSYQSAAFLSVIHALDALPTDYCGEPGVWETSRTGFERMTFTGQPKWQLLALRDEKPAGNGPEKGFAWSWEMFLVKHFGDEAARWRRPFRLFLSFLTTCFFAATAVVIVEAWRATRKPHWHGRITGQVRTAFPVGSYRRTAAGIFAAIIMICVTVGLSERLFSGFPEPFLWFNGISIWPSLIIRVFGGILGFYFFLKSFVDIDGSADKIRGPNVAGTTLAYVSKMAGFQKSRGKVDLRYFARLLIFVGLFMILQMFMMSIVSGGQRSFFTPGRGTAAFFCHEITRLFFEAVFQLLIWSAVLRHLRCQELLLCLLRMEPKKQVTSIYSGDSKHGKLVRAWSSDHWTRWWSNFKGRMSWGKAAVPIEAESGLPTGILTKSEISALFNYNEAVVQSIIYPFTMLVVLLASRHPIFDAWNFPATLAISFAVILLILVCCAFLLNDSANRLAEKQKELLDCYADKQAHAAEFAAWQDGHTRGSFVPFWKQPVIQALFLAATGLGLQLLQ